jgi:hypothetical protein
VLRHQFVVKKVWKFSFLFLYYSKNIGWIWSKNTMTADNWLLDVKLRVTGRGRIGADGMVNDFLLRDYRDLSIMRTSAEKKHLENLIFI